MEMMPVDLLDVLSQTRECDLKATYWKTIGDARNRGDADTSHRSNAERWLGLYVSPEDASAWRAAHGNRLLVNVRTIPTTVRAALKSATESGMQGVALMRHLDAEWVAVQKWPLPSRPLEREP